MLLGSTWCIGLRSAVPPGPFGTVCTSTVTTPFSTRAPGENWDGLREIAIQYGWSVA